MGRGIARSHHVHFHQQPMQKSLDRKSSRNVRKFAIPLRKGAIHTYLFGNLQAVQNDLSEKRVPNSCLANFCVHPTECFKVGGEIFREESKEDIGRSPLNAKNINVNICGKCFGACLHQHYSRYFFVNIPPGMGRCANIMANTNFECENSKWYVL